MCVKQPNHKRKKKRIERGGDRPKRDDKMKSNSV